MVDIPSIAPDPALTVLYMSLEGKTTNFAAAQDNYGLVIDLPLNSMLSFGTGGKEGGWSLPD